MPFNPVVIACAVCMGASDSPLARGMNAGVLVLLGVTVSVLGGFACGILAFVRRSRLMDGV
jgi:hypothetical protein